jgi:hypothetical protein
MVRRPSTVKDCTGAIGNGKAAVTATSIRTPQVLPLNADARQKNFNSSYVQVCRSRLESNNEVDVTS